MISFGLIVLIVLFWFVSMLFIDIFVGFLVFLLFFLVVGVGCILLLEKIVLFVFIVFVVVIYSVMFGVLFGLCVLGWMVWLFLKECLLFVGLV